MNISIIGCGRWGTFLAWYLDTVLNKGVTLYGRSTSSNFNDLIACRKNEYVTLSSSVTLTSDLEETCKNDTIIVSIGSQSLRGLCEDLASLGIQNKTIILCMKGLETDTGFRLSQIAERILDKSNKIAVWIGPGQVQDISRGVPNCMVVDSNDRVLAYNLANQFSSDLIHFHRGWDIIGNEIGAASKNVIGVAAGMLDGLGLTSLKGALMVKGAREVSRLIYAAGGESASAYGLCHLGDYEATLFSPYSHNRQFGEAFVSNKEYKDLAEGFYTVKAIMTLCDKYGIEMPVCSTVYKILYEDADAKGIQDVILGSF